AAEGTAPDPDDPATTTCTAPSNHDYTQYLRADGLKGARIGIPRTSFYSPATLPGAERPRGGLNPAQTKVMDDAIAILKAQGAVVVVPVEIPSIASSDPKENYLQW